MISYFRNYLSRVLLCFMHCKISIYEFVDYLLCESLSSVLFKLWYFQVQKATGLRLVRNQGSIVPYKIEYSRLEEAEEEDEKENKNKEEKVELLKDSSKMDDVAIPDRDGNASKSVVKSESKAPAISIKVSLLLNSFFASLILFLFVSFCFMSKQFSSCSYPTLFLLFLLCELFRSIFASIHSALLLIILKNCVRLYPI